MIKRLLFLHYFIFHLFLVMHNSYASAWLINEDRYRYIISVSNIDKSSKYSKQIRTDLRLKIEKKLESLRTELKLLDNNSSAQYKILSLYIKALEHEVRKLLAYQDQSSGAFIIEYGIDKNYNLGIQLLYKNNKIQSSKYQTKTYTNKDISFYYKIKLFQNSTRIISIQPRIFYYLNSANCQQFSCELSLLSGKSRRLGSVSIFFEKAFTLGKNLKIIYEGKNYYIASSTIGVKFKNNVMLMSFIQYHLRKNHNYIYNKTLYYQLLVAKQINFANLKSRSLTTAISYFVDKSLINKNYKISGIKFSIWMDI